MNPRKFLESLKYALEGLVYCIVTQRNMKIHLTVAIFVQIFGILVGIGRLELIMVTMAISMVLICEIINTAVEKAVDTATQEYHPVAKLAKDVAAGAVLVASISAVIVGLLVFGRYFGYFFKSI